jgi:hypothetical protein
VANAENGDQPNHKRNKFLQTVWTRFIGYPKRKLYERRAKYKKETASERAERRTADATFIISIFTVVIAFVSIAQWCVLSGTLDEMKQGFSVERAYVFNDGFEGYKGEQIKSGLSARFSFKNFGKTPAMLKTSPAVKCDYAIVGTPEGLTIRFSANDVTDESGFIAEGVIIAPNDRIGPFSASLNATKEQIDQARIGIGRIYCQAAIGYSDMRDNFHETKVCMGYNFKYNAFILCPDKGANSHT